jgi:hypothetical protein
LVVLAMGWEIGDKDTTDEDSGQLHMHFGSSYKTSDFIVELKTDSNKI